MAVYFVTGKLGSGKTLAAVGKIRDKLIEGRPVATNLDLKLNKLVGSKAKQTVVYRVPDKPKLEHMKALGSGNASYDEEKNGLIVLDECGTWFNSRDWQDKDRRPLIDWLLHARKLGWDLIFIIQDVSMIDKQARKSVGEHVVYCRRLDRVKVPFADSLYRLIFSKDMPKAKAHLGIVKYGDLPNSLTVDRWWYMARDLYPAYDTKQAFTDDYSHGIYQLVPPWYTHGRYAVKKDVRFYMRMTRIHLKRFSKVVVLAGGIVAGAGMATALQPEPVTQVVSPEPKKTQSQDQQQSQPDKPFLSTSSFVDSAEKPQPLADKFDGFVISGVAQDEDGTPIYMQLANGDKKYSLDNLRSAGHIVRMVSHCEVLIMNQSRDQSVRVHTSYCPPDNRPSTPPQMTDEQLRNYWLSDRM